MALADERTTDRRRGLSPICAAGIAQSLTRTVTLPEPTNAFDGLLASIERLEPDG